MADWADQIASGIIVSVRHITSTRRNFAAALRQARLDALKEAQNKIRLMAAMRPEAADEYDVGWDAAMFDAEVAIRSLEEKQP